MLWLKNSDPEFMFAAIVSTIVCTAVTIVPLTTPSSLTWLFETRPGQ